MIFLFHRWDMLVFRRENEYMTNGQSIIFHQPRFPFQKATPLKINIEPKIDGLEDEFPFPGVYSQLPY